MRVNKERMNSSEGYTGKIKNLAERIASADAVLIGAGAGMSVAAGFTYSGRRFEENFSDFIQKYGYQDMYTAGFYPYGTPEEYWAYWSRYIEINRYREIPGTAYEDLLELVRDKEYFVLTTNVDHCFQKTGFEKQRLFYTQGDYGLWQCSIPCHNKTYDNEAIVKKMVAKQRNMRVPPKLVPHCPFCGAPLSMNLRADRTFVEDSGWQRAADRYEEFLRRHSSGNTLFLELGVGYNTPGIVKYPFREMTRQNPDAFYVCINLSKEAVPEEIRSRSLCLAGDIGEILRAIAACDGIPLTQA